MLNGALESDSRLILLQRRVQQSHPPESLLREIVGTISSRYYGLEALALASVIEAPHRRDDIRGLPNLPGLAETPEEKTALVRLWLRAWRHAGFWLSAMPAEWAKNEVQGRSGRFASGDFGRFIGTSGPNRQAFQSEWLPSLLHWFTEPEAANSYRLRGGELSLEIGGQWAYCDYCRTTQRPFPRERKVRQLWPRRGVTDRSGCGRCFRGPQGLLSLPCSQGPSPRARPARWHSSLPSTPLN